jgi:hypothetical protein
MLSMSMNTAIRGKGESSIIIRTTGCKKQHSTVMHAITVDGRKLPDRAKSQVTEWCSRVRTRRGSDGCNYGV